MGWHPAGCHLVVTAAGVTGVADTVGVPQEIVLALIALIATSTGALVYVIRNGRYVKTAAEEATAANRAVNNVGAGRHSLYDMVEHIRDDVKELKKQQDEFDSHGWGTLPSDISNAVGLTTTIRDLQHNTEAVGVKLDTIIGELREHVEWEMNTKQPEDT